MRYVVVAIAMIATSPASADICIYRPAFEEVLAAAKMKLVVVAELSLGPYGSVPLRVYIDRNGGWIMSRVISESVVCPLAAGEAWTTQEDIPAAELRPSPSP